MKYSRTPREITEPFWDSTVVIAEKRKKEIEIYCEDHCKKINFPVGDKGSSTAILSCYAPDGRETERSAYHEEDGKIALSIHDPEGRKEAIRRAIRDLMTRTLKRKPENENNDFNQAVEKELLPKINEWLNDSRTDFSEEAFDTWHAGACKAVLTVLREYYTNNDEAETVVQYGKSQKIVNMTMKGLYCLKGADQKGSYFDHCHIPLDSFTLEWFSRNILLPRKDANTAFMSLTNTWKDPLKFEEYLNGKRTEKEKTWDKSLRAAAPNWEELLQDLKHCKEKYDKECPPIRKREAKANWCRELSSIQPNWIIEDVLHKSYVVSWSSIPETPREKVYGYHQYVTWIRSYFNSANPYQTDAGEKLTAFQAEFYIWPEIQLRLAAESFIFELNPDKYKGKESDPSKKRADISDLPLAELIERVTHEIREYEEKHT